MRSPEAYAELQVTSNFSFLRGASHPEELIARAAELGLHAIAITDRNTVAGVVRAHLAARETGIRFLPGARIDLVCGNSFLCLPTDRDAWGRLTGLLSVGKLRAGKGDCQLATGDLGAHAGGQIAIALPPATLSPFAPADDAAWGRFEEFTTMLAGIFPGRAYLAGQWLQDGNDSIRLARLARLAARTGAALVAVNDVHFHVPARQPLQDVLTCIRRHVRLDAAGRQLFANAERHLKTPAEMAALFAAWPEAVARTTEIADAINFSLDDLRYEYPDDPIPGGRTPDEELARSAWGGARWRYPGGIPERVQEYLQRELRLVAELGYAPYFLTVRDIVGFAREAGILCQGRGSAANSAICFCLGITAVDPAVFAPLFERFISRERNEPPDIDVDFEHERREEVLQHVYARYGRARAALTATVITYRSRSALREVARVFGLGGDTLTALSSAARLRRDDSFAAASLREAGLDPRDPRLQQVVEMARVLTGFPRHLSQHPGGFVVTRDALHRICPIGNAAMAGRTVLEWNKDDIDALGILKIDILGLGMLTCLRKSFVLLAEQVGRKLELASLPQEDAAVYDMLCEGDAVGVFQVESRAQLSMLPRLRPRCFYDLAIEVAIVRPGPIQGEMVHPYLRRRSGKEKVSYPSRELREVLGKTLGVPLFQEQAMRIAIVAAGFSAGEADSLRRAMAAYRRPGAVQEFRDRFIRGMRDRGYAQEFAERCFRQIEGFGQYGFPESHAISFAVLVYASAWVKCHYPAIFACALLNSQPMGFYAPAQIVRDAREHGVEILPVDVNASSWDCTIEPGADGALALRLGLRLVRGLAKADAMQLVAARGNGYADLAALHRRTGLSAVVLQRLAGADAFASTGRTRRQALWDAKALPGGMPGSWWQEEVVPDTGTVRLPLPVPAAEVAEDYAALGVSLRPHPMQLLRTDPGPAGQRLVRTVTAKALTGIADGTMAEVAGLVLVRQRPRSANGVLFLTLEDESGTANIIVWPHIQERFRRAALMGRLLVIRGTLQREGVVVHLVAREMEDLSESLAGLLPAHARRTVGRLRSRDFR